MKSIKEKLKGLEDSLVKLDDKVTKYVAKHPIAVYTAATLIPIGVSLAHSLSDAVQQTINAYNSNHSQFWPNHPLPSNWQIAWDTLTNKTYHANTDVFEGSEPSNVVPINDPRVKIEVIGNTAKVCPDYNMDGKADFVILYRKGAADVKPGSYFYNIGTALKAAIFGGFGAAVAKVFHSAGKEKLAKKKQAKK